MAEAVLNIDEQYGDAVEGGIIDCASLRQHQAWQRERQRRPRRYHALVRLPLATEREG